MYRSSFHGKNVRKTNILAYLLTWVFILKDSTNVVLAGNRERSKSQILPRQVNLSMFSKLRQDGNSKAVTKYLLEAVSVEIQLAKDNYVRLDKAFSLIKDLYEERKTKLLKIYIIQYLTTRFEMLICTKMNVLKSDFFFLETKILIVNWWKLYRMKPCFDETVFYKLFWHAHLY